MKKITYLLLIATMALVGCGGGSNNGSNNGTNMISMTGSHSYSPVNLMVHAGETATWKNTDSVVHTVDSDTGVPGLDSETKFTNGAVPPNGTFSWPVPAGTPAGTVFFYHCDFHGTAGDGTHLGTGMSGSITVQ